MTAGKDFALALRGGLVATAEVAGLSALGVSLAALMWATVSPKGAMAESVADTGIRSDDRFADIVTRMSRIDDPFARNGATQAVSVADASGFVLHSTRSMTNGISTAILSPSGGQQGAYAVGEEIAPGVTLAMVASDHVEIDVGGQRMRVAFPGASAAPAIQMATNLPADYSASAKSAALPNVSGLPLQPVNRNGRPAGFEVMRHADGSVLSAAGLQPGDILISVNGVSAASADLSAYRAQLLSGQPVEIRFERGGQVHTARLGS